MGESGSRLSAVGLVLGGGVVLAAHAAMGGRLVMFLQPEAILVVLGGTLAALLVSYPVATLREAWRAVRDLTHRRGNPPEAIVPTLIGCARKARRYGLAAVERDIDQLRDPFLARALSLLVAGLPLPVVRETLEIEARVLAERDEQRAQVLEAAPGYAPTLGIVGAVLGLMRVMQTVAGQPIGPGIAAAFVATIYGVGAANLLFLPLATRLRARARYDAVCRELVIDGVVAMRDGASPGVLEERLAGYLTLHRPAASWAEVA